MASRQASSDEILLRYRTVTVKGGMKSAFSQSRRGGRGAKRIISIECIKFFRFTGKLLGYSCEKK